MTIDSRSVNIYSGSESIYEALQPQTTTSNLAISSKTNEILNSLSQLFESINHLGKALGKFVPSKIEKLSQLKGRCFETKLEYINFPFEQSIDQGWVQSVDQAMGFGNIKTKMAETSGIFYIIRDAQGKKIAIFKPEEKIAYPPNHDQSALREHLAWKLGNKLIDMPAAYVIEVNLMGKATTGSLQPYIDSEGNYNEITNNHWLSVQLNNQINQIRKPWIPLENHMENILGEYIQGSRKVANELMADSYTQIRRIALLDILLLNFERINTQNLLLKQKECGYHFIPINHNLAFAKNLTGIEAFAFAPWYSSEAIRLPFDNQEIEWLNELDIEGIKKDFLEKGLDSERVQQFGIMADLVQTGARAGLTLFDITTLLIQPFKTNPFPFSNRIHEVLNSMAEFNVPEIHVHIEKMVLEKRDEIDQFGMTDLTAYQMRLDQLLDKSPNIYYNYLYTPSIDTSLTLTKTRQAAHDRYIAKGECPKVVLDSRLNTTRICM